MQVMTTKNRMGMTLTSNKTTFPAANAAAIADMTEKNLVCRVGLMRTVPYGIRLSV